MANEAQIITNLSLHKDIVVPLGATFIGGLFGILTGVIIAAKSEKFRRLAIWEPYANCSACRGFPADLVILDELGYLPFSKAGGALLFHLLSKLYERTSSISSRYPLVLAQL